MSCGRRGFPAQVESRPAAPLEWAGDYPGWHTGISQAGSWDPALPVPSLGSCGWRDMG